MLGAGRGEQRLDRRAARAGTASSDRCAAPKRAASAAALSGAAVDDVSSSPACASDSAARSVIGETPMSAMRPGVRAMPFAQSCTAISASDTRPSPSFVSPRTRAAILSASSNTQPQARAAEAELERALLAARTWPTISVSPTQAESSPAAVRNRCSAAPSPCHARRRRSASPGAARAAGQQLRTRRGAGPATGVRSLRAKISSTRLQVARYASSSRLSRCAKSWSCAARALLVAARTRRALRCRLAARRRRSRPRCSSTPLTVPWSDRSSLRRAAAGHCHGSVTALAGEQLGAVDAAARGRTRSRPGSGASP